MIAPQKEEDYYPIYLDLWRSLGKRLEIMYMKWLVQQYVKGVSSSASLDDLWPADMNFPPRLEQWPTRRRSAALSPVGRVAEREQAPETARPASAGRMHTKPEYAPQLEREPEEMDVDTSPSNEMPPNYAMHMPLASTQTQPGEESPNRRDFWGTVMGPESH